MITSQKYALILAAIALQASLSEAQDSATSTVPSEAAERRTVLDEVVVTAARRREESVQASPVAVTALNDVLLEQARILSTSDLGKLAPSLQTFRQLATADMAGMYLRGFGVSSDDPSLDPPIAVYVDGSYQPHVMGTMIDLFDVEKVEVLRGPQGTLFGKNAPSGAVNITTKRPTGEWDARFQFDYGRFDRTEVRAGLDFPIVKDVLAGKIFFIDKEGGDYIKNRTLDRHVGGEDIQAGRVGFLFTPSKMFDWYLTVSRSWNNSPQHGIRDQTPAGPLDPPFVNAPYLSCTFFGYCDPSLNPKHTTDSALPNDQDINVTDYASEMNLKLQPVTLTAVTAYRDYDNTNYEDADGEPEPILEAQGQNIRYHTFSQELRVSSADGGGWDLGGKLSWVAGLYYFSEGFQYDRPLVVFGGPVAQGQRGSSESKAAFGQIVYHLTDAWSASFGARRTKDEKDHQFSLPGAATIEAIQFSDKLTKKWSNTSIEFGTQYQFDADRMAYIRYAEGYRGGGFLGNPPDGIAASYDPEEAKSIEVGLKADWLERRVRTNLAVYRSKYTDLQRSIVKPSPFPPGFVLATQNAAKGRVTGVELESIFVPIDPLTLKLTVAYMDAEYTSFFADATGSGVPRDNTDFEWGYAPEWSGFAAAEYVLERAFGSLTFSADYTFRSEMYAQDLPSRDALVDDVGLLGAAIKYRTPDGRYTVTAYGANLTDKYYTDSLTTTNSITLLYNDAPPRTWGVSVAAKF